MWLLYRFLRDKTLVRALSMEYIRFGSNRSYMGIYAQSGLRVITVVKGPFRGKPASLACRNALNRGNGPAGPAKSSYKWKNHMYIHTTYNSNQAHQLRRFWCACMYSPYNSYTCSITGCALFEFN